MEKKQICSRKQQSEFKFSPENQKEKAAEQKLFVLQRALEQPKLKKNTQKKHMTHCAFKPNI